ncbi:prolyl-tRNA synthetase 2-like protein, mitochondrial isoform X2 [Oratosquilla oratoria]|uniref:prolyl-tRNA synthetase 2-like protein, mitochondrial isoform X2 n=1 Tax=Oratosquilla oratoria TaxID=337810 RepID=UPI003F770187
MANRLRSKAAQMFHIQMSHYHKVSKLFQPVSQAPKYAIKKKDESSSISQKLMTELGALHPRSNGMYALLPLGLRALEKLNKSIDEEMSYIGAQKIALPILTSGHLWKKTGRWKSTGPELLKVKDRHEKDFVLSPTHEESVTDMIAGMYPLSYRQFPLKLYQISTKIRDEMKPRFGLLRCKEFVMKDLYTFDSSEAGAAETYEEVNNAYLRIFRKIGIPFLRDILWICQSCGEGTNSELITEDSQMNCHTCGGVLKKVMGIEVGHTFLLGRKYSEPMGAFYQDLQGKPQPLHMGCYGIGVSRLLAAAVEVLSTKAQMKWPLAFAPYKVCIIGPKKGSKEWAAVSWQDSLASVLSQNLGLGDDIIVDDRSTLTIGKRVLEAKNTGYPFVVIVGKKACEAVPQFEVIDNDKEEVQVLTQLETLNFVKKHCL